MDCICLECCFEPFPKYNVFFRNTCLSKNNVFVQAGVYVFQLMDHYTAIISVILLAFVEVVVVCWLYGKNPEWLLICPFKSQKLSKRKNNLLTWKSRVAFTLSSFHHAGVDKLSDHLHEMTGNRPNIAFRLCWKFISPLLILVSQQTLYIIQTYQNNEVSFHCRP